MLRLQVDISYQFRQSQKSGAAMNSSIRSKRGAATAAANNNNSNQRLKSLRPRWRRAVSPANSKIMRRAVRPVLDSRRGSTGGLVAICGCCSGSILQPGGGRFVKKTFRKYNFPHTKNNLRHYFYFLPVRVSNILKFWFVCSVYWVLSAVFLQPFFQNSLLFAKQTLFGLV